MTVEEEKKELMTCVEVCDRLRISRETLYRQLRKGGPLSKIDDKWIGGKRLWFRSSVDAFINGEQS